MVAACVLIVIKFFFAVIRSYVSFCQPCFTFVRMNWVTIGQNCQHTSTIVAFSSD